MPSLKAIRKRIISVKSTQKITRAMKMVAGARLNRAQQRITDLRPYAVKTHDVLAEDTWSAHKAEPQEGGEGRATTGGEPAHPLLVEREEKRVLVLVLTSDRGLCGAFNTNINKAAEREWHRRVDEGQELQLAIIGRKGRDYFTRRNAPIMKYLQGVWDSVNIETARDITNQVLAPFNKGEIDAIYVVYNEFKSAISQSVTVERLLPVERTGEPPVSLLGRTNDFIYEPSRSALLDALVPMYLEISILRALYESTASELGARMTAMDAATKNAKEMISSLTLQYNRARQAAITKELMEIIGGSEALKD